LQDVPNHETMICVPQGALLALLAAILHSTMTSPVWMPQFLSGGQFIPHCWMIRYRHNGPYDD